MQTQPNRERTRWLGLAALILPTLLVSMDMSSLYLAIPRLSEDIRPTSSQLLWIIDIYGFLLAGLLIPMGNIGDRIGRRRLLIIGTAIFGVASALAAFSPNATTLIITRALMGVGGATLMPSTLSLIRSLFEDGRERGKAIGIWAAGFSIGAVLGPIIGGVLLEFFHWGAIFLINVPVVIILLIAVPLLLPEYRQENPERLDVLSVFFALGGILPLMFAIKRFAELRTVDALTLIPFVVGAVLLVLFARRQFRIPAPLVDPALLRNARFRTAVIAGMMSLFAIVVGSYFSAQFFQMVLGYRPLTAALIGIPSAIVVGTGSIIAVSLSRRFGLERTFGISFLLGGVGLVIFALTSDSSPWFVLIGSLFTGAGLSVVLTLGTDLVITAAPKERAGAASALSETGIELGAALGLAVLGSLGAYVYTLNMQTAPLAHLDPGIVALAQTTLANALQAVASAEPHVQDAVLAQAKPAFIAGMRAATLVGAAITFVLAWLIPTLLHRSKTQETRAT